MKYNNLIIFLSGVAAGAAVAYAATKKKYEEILEEEIQSVKDTYKNRKELVIEKVEEEPKAEEEVDEPKEDKVVELNKYTNVVDNSGYVNYSKYMSESEKPKKEEPITTDSVKDWEDEPYVINEEQYGESGYDTQVLTYYADDVLVDDLDDVIEDHDIHVGLSNLKIFEEFGASFVYVRNDIFKVDYKIVKDDWKYSDFSDQEPVQQEVRDKRPHEL